MATNSNFIVKNGLRVGTTNVIDSSGVWIGATTNIKGPQGLQGAQGVQGATGAQGPQGTTGSAGFQGRQGVQGTAGAQGVQGAQGAAGAQGPQGVQGPAGFQGRQGVQGVAGAQGVQGAQGAAGAQGPQGVQGATGVTGPTGVQGVAGVQGVQGAQGAAGAQGPQGVQGATGVQGAVGISGVQGLAGAQGVQGPSGTPGAQGPAGFQGASGNAITSVDALGVNTPAGPQGTIRATGTISAGYSDRRLKNVISSIDNSLKRIDNISGVYYEPNELAKHFGFQSSERQIGLIAQEVQKILPEVIIGAPFDSNKHGHSLSGENYLTIQYERVVPLLIEALKEQKEQIDYMKSKL